MRLPLLLLALVAGSCGSGSTPPERPHPLVLIGVDGLEPAIVQRLVDAGRMPHLADLAERGVMGELDTMIPTYSPVLWTTAATGQEPEIHGIVDFIEPVSGYPFTSNCRRVPALWNIVSEAGLGVDVVGWWVTWPAEPINGRVVASYAAQAQANIMWKGNLWKDIPSQTWPDELLDEVAPHVTWFQDTDALRAAFWEAFDKPAHDRTQVTDRAITDLSLTFAADRSYSAIAEQFLADRTADLTLVYLAMPDVAGHRFWRYYEPDAFEFESPQEDIEAFAGFIDRSYEEIDRMIGRLVAASPEDAHVIVLSDHGMHADAEMWNEPDMPSSGHHQDGPPGIFAAAGPLVKQQGSFLGDELRARLGHILGVAPFALRVLGLPVPEHWPGSRQGINELEYVLDDLWRRDHPHARTRNRDGEFRKATAPQLPSAGVNTEFMRAFGALGYWEFEEEEDEGDDDDSEEGR